MPASLNRLNTHAKNPWIFCPAPKPTAARRLFCFPFAGGNAMNYREWPDYFHDTEICAIQLPGRSNRLNTPPINNIAQIVVEIAENILPLLDRPYALFGHSMGALISFELSRYFRQHQIEMPQHLFLSGRRAPHLPQNRPMMSNLPKEQFIQRVIELDGTPSQVAANQELLDLIEPSLRADFKAVESYQHQIQAALNLNFHVMGGLQDKWVTRQDLEAWKTHTDAEFHLHLFDGGHFYLKEHLQAMARIIEQTLLQDKARLAQ